MTNFESLNTGIRYNIGMMWTVCTSRTRPVNSRRNVWNLTVPRLGRSPLCRYYYVRGLSCVRIIIIIIYFQIFLYPFCRFYGLVRSCRVSYIFCITVDFCSRTSLKLVVVCLLVPRVLLHRTSVYVASRAIFVVLVLLLHVPFVHVYSEISLCYGAGIQRIEHYIIFIICVCCVCHI